MKFEELLQKSNKEGQDRMLKLMNCMIQAGEADELPRLEQNPNFLQEMLEKYHL